MKWLSVALSLVLLVGAHQLATHLAQKHALPVEREGISASTSSAPHVADTQVATRTLPSFPDSSARP